MHSTKHKSVIHAMQRKWEEGGAGPVEWLVQAQRRIAALDREGPGLNAVLEWNPEAEAIAAALAREAKLHGKRGLLHGIPVLIKDNIGTGDGMHTSAGSLALKDRFAQRDSTVALRLRGAGAVICGKTNMTELANFMTDGMPNGYSARGGQVRHAWKAGADPSGSSTGSAVAVAAGYVPLVIGTETCGSIISPSAAAGIVGLKPTVGWVSRSGIIPVAPSQDTAGPMARTVADAALAFSLMAGCDPEDPATGLSLGRPVPGPDCCTLSPDGLKGVRLGLFLLDDEDKPVQKDAFHTAVKLLEGLGAEMVPFSPPKGLGDAMMTILTHEFRPAMDAALRFDEGSVRTLAGIADYNSAHAQECLRYGQTHIQTAIALPRPMLTRDYFIARQAVREGLEAMEKSFAQLRLDAVVSMCGLVAFPVTGCPALTLPVGMDDAEGLPVPLTLNGLPFSEGKLLTIGAALEAVVNRTFTPPCCMTV
jgi:amidase